MVGIGVFGQGLLFKAPPVRNPLSNNLSITNAGTYIDC
jgi:hypothetical protein